MTSLLPYAYSAVYVTPMQFVPGHYSLYGYASSGDDGLFKGTFERRAWHEIALF